MTFSFRLFRAVWRNNSCWTMFNDHYWWTATRSADIVWVCTTVINRLFHKTPDNNHHSVNLIFVWVVGVWLLCIVLYLLKSDIIFSTIKACSETALNRSCSRTTYFADREKRHIVKIIYVNGTQSCISLWCWGCDAVFEGDIMSGILCLKWNARDCICFWFAPKKELKTVFKQEISRQRLKLLFKVNPRHRASCTRSVQVIRGELLAIYRRF